MKSPFFSIIVPSYNQDQYLGLALDSLLAQSFSDWEAVIVNDGSTDNTKSVMMEYAEKDSRFKLYHQENGGVASALNCGIQHASGEWLCWLSSDDLYEPEKLKIHFDAVNDNPDIKFFQTHWSLLYDETNQIQKTDLWLPTPLPEYQIISFCRTNYVHGNAILIHRTVFDEVGLFDERFRMGQDYDMWLRISSKFEAKFINHRTCITRIHKGQDTNTFPIGGVLDSTWSCINFINKTQFEDFFPLLDLSDMEQAQNAIITTLQIVFYENAFMYKAGYIPALSDRLCEWVNSESQIEKQVELIEFINKVTSMLLNDYNPKGLEKIKSSIDDNLSEQTNLIYKAYDFVNECISYSKEQLHEGNQELAHDLERFLDRVYTVDKNISKRSEPILYGYVGKTPSISVVVENILSWDIIANDSGLSSITHQIKYKCPKCESCFNSNMRIPFSENSLCRQFICPNCKTSFIFDLALFKSYFLDKTRFNYTEALTKNNKRKRCAFYLKNTNILGGGNKIIYKHIQWLESLGVDITIYSQSEPPSWTVLPGVYHQVKSFDSIVESDIADIAIVSSILDIPTILKKHPPARIVHFCQGYEGYHFGTDFNEMRSDKYIFTQLHSIPVQTVVVSHHLKKLFTTLLGRQTYLIPNSIDHSVYKPLSQVIKDTNSLLFIGNPFHALKGFMFLAHALKLLHLSPNKIANPKLYLVADIPEDKKEYISQELANDIGCKIVILNNLNSHRVAQLMNTVSATICTSMYEGFSLPILESMACGTPVITTNNMGTESFCIHGYNSSIVKFGDVKALQEVIHSTLTTDSFGRIRYNGLKTAKLYTELHSFRTFVNTYSNLLDLSFNENSVQKIESFFNSEKQSILKSLDKYRITNDVSFQTNIQRETNALDQWKNYVSIFLIVNVDTKSLNQFLIKIEEITRYPHEIIFICPNHDNQQKNELELLTQSHANYFFEKSKKSGISSEINESIKFASGDYFLIMDAKQHLSHGWLDKMVISADSSDKIGLTGYRIQKSKINLDITIEKGNNTKPNVVEPTWSVPLTCMMMKRATYNITGPFDNQFQSLEHIGYDYNLRVKEETIALMNVIEENHNLDSTEKSYVSSPRELGHDIKRFNSKWPHYSLDIFKDEQESLDQINTRLLNEGIEALKNNQIEKSISIFEDVLRTNPIDENAFFCLALAARQKGDNESAVKSLEQLLKVNPESATAYNQFGIILTEFGEYEKGEKMFSKAIEKDPEFLDAKRNIGELMIAMENYGQGIDTLVQIIEDYPDDIPTLLRLVELSSEAGNNSQLEKYVEQVLRYDPENQMIQQFTSTQSDT